MSAVRRGHEPIAARAREMIAAALEEDLGAAGDVTTEAVLPEGVSVSARLEARERFVLAGLPLASATLEQVAERGLGSASVEPLREDGHRAEEGEVVERIQG